jgi:hypothetical protein
MILLLLVGCAGHGAGPGSGDTDPGEIDPGADPFANLPDDAGHIPDVLVDCGGGGDFTTLGAAVAAVAPGTHVGLAPCTYTEDLDFAGKALDIFGIDGAGTTTLHGTGTGPLVTVERGETIGTRLAGVTLTGGRFSEGAVISALASTLTLEDVVITGNSADYTLVFAEGAAFEFTDVTITGNTLGTSGTGMYVDNGTLVAQRLSMTTSSGQSCIYGHNATELLDSTLDCGAPYGVYLDGGELHVRRSRIESDGTAVWGLDLPDTPNERLWVFTSTLVGADTAMYAGYMHVKADNDVFWGGTVGLDIELVHPESYVYDSAAVGRECGIRTDGSASALEWNALQGVGLGCASPGATDVTGDPGFADAPADFHIDATSPLVDAGNPLKEDSDGTRRDIGVYGGKEADGPR